MVPNPYLMEELARQREAQMAARAREAWKFPPARRSSVGQRLGILIVIGSVISCSLLWLFM